MDDSTDREGLAAALGQLSTPQLWMVREGAWLAVEYLDLGYPDDPIYRQAEALAGAAETHLATRGQAHVMEHEDTGARGPGTSAVFSVGVGPLRDGLAMDRDDEDLARLYGPDLEDEGEARQLASEWHGGQFTGLYKLSSSGTVTSEALVEVEGLIRSGTPTAQAHRHELGALAKWLGHQLADQGQEVEG